VRNRLRRDHGYPAEAGRRFGVIAIHSPAPPRPAGGLARASGGAALACAGYGSIVTVTASMGMAAAGAAIDALLSRGGSR
jgi:tRNA threonylcarbamoyladenosine dehydratase